MGKELCSGKSLESHSLQLCALFYEPVGENFSTLEILLCSLRQILRFFDGQFHMNTSWTREMYVTTSISHRMIIMSPYTFLFLLFLSFYCPTHNSRVKFIQSASSWRRVEIIHIAGIRQPRGKLRRSNPLSSNNSRLKFPQIYCCNFNKISFDFFHSTATKKKLKTFSLTIEIERKTFNNLRLVTSRLLCFSIKVRNFIFLLFSVIDEKSEEFL